MKTQDIQSKLNRIAEYCAEQNQHFSQDSSFDPELANGYADACLTVEELADSFEFSILYS